MRYGPFSPHGYPLAPEEAVEKTRSTRPDRLFVLVFIPNGFGKLKYEALPMHYAVWSSRHREVGTVINLF